VYDRSLHIQVRAWALPCHDHWRPADVIAPDLEAREALFPVVVDHLGRHTCGRKLLVLGPIPEATPLWQGFKETHLSEICIHAESPSNFFDCSTPYEQLLERMTKHFQRNLRAHRNKLQLSGDVKLVTVSAQDGVDAIEAELENFMTLEASGWKGRNGAGSAILLQPKLVGFYRDLATKMLGQEDRCEINALYLNGRCIASQFCVRTGQEYAILKIAYDEAFARLGPGQLLLLSTLERCCADPQIKKMDLVSDESWFKDWQTEKVSMLQAHITLGRRLSVLRFRYSPAMRIVRRLRCFLIAQSTTGGALLRARAPHA